MAKLNLREHQEKMPQHVGIIMDGNGRWATKRGLPRSMGHKEGAKTFRKIAKRCWDLKIPYLTVYAFSTENWKRPQDEIDAIMDMLRDYLDETEKHRDENVRTVFIGDMEPLAEDLKEKIAYIQRESAKNDGITLSIALNYGGRAEITHGVRQLAEKIAKGELSPDSITEETLESSLYTSGQPDPDLIIRPSGEKRLSNFMIWQAAYAEYVFMDILWPDFTEDDLDAALLEYINRDRRFGGLG